MTTPGVTVTTPPTIEEEARVCAGVIRAMSVPAKLQLAAAMLEKRPHSALGRSIVEYVVHELAVQALEATVTTAPLVVDRPKAELSDLAVLVKR